MTGLNLDSMHVPMKPSDVIHKMLAVELSADQIARAGNTGLKLVDPEGNVILAVLAEDTTEHNAIMNEFVKESGGQRNSGNSEEVDMVNHPPHYKGIHIELGECDTYGNMKNWAVNTYEVDGKRYMELDCIDLMERIKDSRLATAFKYIWRVALGGGKGDGSKNYEDIDKARWYILRWLEKNKVNG